jgi:predicted alpha/beta superfamily hydrolase
MYIEPSRLVRGNGFAWDHEVQVALPASYFHTDASYPVLWITDGSLFFDLAHGIVHLLSISGFPEFIVVGVGNPRDAPVDEHHRRRMFDFFPEADPGWPGPGEEARAEYGLTNGVGGGASRFLDFLVNQLRPALSHDYRMSDSHCLFGSSAGGAFVLFAFLSRPGSFSNYICGSPVLNVCDFALFESEEQLATACDDLDAGLFLAAGSEEAAEMAAFDIIGSMSRMAQTLYLRKYPSLRLSFHVYPQETHVTAPAVVLSHGFRALWRPSEPSPASHPRKESPLKQPYPNHPLPRNPGPAPNR